MIDPTPQTDDALSEQALTPNPENADLKPGSTAWLRDAPAVDVAAWLADQEDGQIDAMLATMSTERQADVLRHLPLHLQADWLTTLPHAHSQGVLQHLYPDEQADLLSALPHGQDALLAVMAQAERNDIMRLASYPQGSVGAIMNSQYAMLTPELTTSQALAELRRIAPDRETIYNAYVVDGGRRLIGVTSLRRLILAEPNRKIGDMMTRDPVSVHLSDDQEEAAQKVAHYDFIAMPVVDDEGRMVGIVTADDAYDVLADEATEDFHKSGGSLGGTWPERLKDATVSFMYRKRVFWLVLLVFANVFSGAGIAFFEDLIASNVALVFFLPLLIDSGGNAGSQSATLMVRALATGDVQLRDWASMLGKELTVAFLLGLTMALAVSAVGVFRGGAAIALTVACTMLIVVMVGSLVGMSLPFLLSHLKGDPATASSPLITTISDASGIIIYFSIASLILPGMVGH